ncbi:MAG: hypothetical protein FWC89_11240, partial [Defluviitaleaceae bacterium]|nr:hypothetical protein [Defluviitaleaceae bacterium]
INALKSEYKSFTPKRLADQIDGNINAQAFNLSAYVIKELQNRNHASTTKNENTFTNNLFIVRA